VDNSTFGKIHFLFMDSRKYSFGERKRKHGFGKSPKPWE
jgi:hypothetical protein